MLVLNDLIKENRCFVIAEIGLSHEGSLGVAIAMATKAAKCGVDAVKFQTHISEYESSKWEEFRVIGNYQDKTRFEYWKRTSFTIDQWRILKEKCDELGVYFLSTPFSIQAAEILEVINVPAWKISSGDINNYPLLDYVAGTKKPVFLSTGMSDYYEIEKSVEYLSSIRENLMIFQCTNSYPCPPEEIGIKEVEKLRNRFNLSVGFSDHSGKIGTGISAFSLGALALEVHVAWDKEYFGPDVTSSLTFQELRELVENLRFLEKSFSTSYSKSEIKKTHHNMRNLFMKGIYYDSDLKAGQVIGIKDLSFKKPLFYIPASEYKSLIGRDLLTDVIKGNPVKLSDFK